MNIRYFPIAIMLCVWGGGGGGLLLGLYHASVNWISIVIHFIVFIWEDFKVLPFADVFQRQHFLLSYFKTLSGAPAGVEVTTSHDSPMLNQLSTGARFKFSRG